MTFKISKNLKVRALFFVLITVILAGTSCTDFLKGKPKNQKIISYKSNKLACLDEVPKSFDRFLQTQADVEEVNKTFECVDQTFNELQIMAEGSESSDYFTVVDIRRILEDFVPNADINEQASVGIIRFKSSLIGGDKDKITKTEITNVRLYLKLLKAEVIKMLPYASLLNVKGQTRVLSESDINAGYVQLSSSLKILLTQSRLIQSNYSFDDLKHLIADMGLVASEQKGVLNLFGEMKKLFVGKVEIKKEEDYFSLIDSFLGIFKIYTLSQQNYIAFSLKDSNTLDNTLNSIFAVIDVIENSLQFKKTQTISSESIDSLITVLLQKNLVVFTDSNADKNLLNLPITSEVLKNFYKSIFVKVFDSGRLGNRNSFQGLTQKHFDNLRRELAIYQVYASFIASLPWKTGTHQDAFVELDIDTIRSKLNIFDPSKLTEIYKRFDTDTQNDITTAFNDMKSEFFLDRPVLFKNKKMVILADQRKLTQSWEDLSFSLFNKVLARILVLGWAQRESTNNQVNTMNLTSDALMDWYTDFQNIGIELKMFDPRQSNTGGKSFLEANLFTYSGNGDETMTFNESIQYLSMITSGGKTVDEIQANLVKNGCDRTDEAKDAFGFYWKTESCFYNDLRKNFKTYFHYLPYMSGYVERLNDQQFAFFYSELMNVARTNPDQKGIKVEYSDLRNMGMLLSYIEALFAVADVNYNWTVTHREIRSIYPRFKSFATTYAYSVSSDRIEKFRKWNQCSNYNVEDLIRESFIFLVYNGRTPEMSDINYISCLFGSDLISFNGEVDRARIVSTFKVLKVVLDSKAK